MRLIKFKGLFMKKVIIGIFIFFGFSALVFGFGKYGFGYHKNSIIHFVYKLDLSSEQKDKMDILKEEISNSHGYMRGYRAGFRKMAQKNRSQDLAKYFIGDTFDSKSFTDNANEQFEQKMKNIKNIRKERIVKQSIMMGKVFNLLDINQREKLVKLLQEDS